LAAPPDRANESGQVGRVVVFGTLNRWPASNAAQGEASAMLYTLIALALAVPTLWILCDLLYSLAMKRLYRRWEAGIERDAEGVRAGCREFTLGQGEDAVLLVHGFGDSPAIFQRIGPALAAKGFTCHGIRLPQFAVPMTRYRTTSAVQWREALRSAIGELRRRHRQVYLLAHSLGAAIAVEAVSEPAAAVDGMVLLAPLFDVSNRRSPLVSARTWYRLLDSLLLFTDYVRTAYPVDLWDKSALTFLRDDKFIPRVVIRELFALVARNQQRAKTFRIPLLMILARHDQVVDNAAAERFFHDCASQPKRLVYVEDAGHMLPIDQGWDKLVEAAGQFFREEVVAEKGGQ
jgi:carboxylesterase